MKTHSRMRALLVVLSAVVVYALGMAPVAEAEPFTLVVIPDSQYYVAETPRKQGKIAMFESQIRWAIDNRASRNIAFVLHEGDIVNNHDPTVGEWQRARPVIKSMDGVVPYALALGNHDTYTVERTAWEFNIFFPLRDFQDWPALGGTFDANAGVLNAYYLFQAGGLNWLIFALEPFPRDAVLAWVDRVADAHPSHNIIVVTHSHVYPDDTLVGSSPEHMYTCTEYGVNPADGSGNNGMDVWSKCLRKHENLLMTFNGHVGGDDLETSAGLVVGTGDHGNKVYQMCADYQETWYNGLFGHMRIVTVDPDLRIISVQTYSPYMDNYGTGPRSQFSFSDVAFTPAGPTITITSPRGIAWWQVGTQQTVSWTSQGVGDRVNIDLSTDGGTTWSSLAADVENSGTQRITVPDMPSTQCLVRVSGAGGSPAETSNATFVISAEPPSPSITVTTPYQWASWPVGTQQTVGWRSQYFSGNVNADISTDGGATWSSLASDIADSGLLTVTVPDTPSTRCLVRVSGASGLPIGTSGDFEIAVPVADAGEGVEAR
ncbi:MAG: metallophosphoesterase [Armatimonadota bacterium]